MDLGCGDGHISMEALKHRIERIWEHRQLLEDIEYCLSVREVIEKVLRINGHWEYRVDVASR